MSITLRESFRHSNPAGHSTAILIVRAKKQAFKVAKWFKLTELKMTELRFPDCLTP